ncbi:hypothetical protein KAU11_02565 [Candidatus Babeliales bacterium]|nr:hypothetical protein [Candidatus Babeliales bacterium]
MKKFTLLGLMALFISAECRAISPETLGLSGGIIGTAVVLTDAFLTGRHCYKTTAGSKKEKWRSIYKHFSSPKRYYREIKKSSWPRRTLVCGSYLAMLSGFGTWSGIKIAHAMGLTETQKKIETLKQEKKEDKKRLEGAEQKQKNQELENKENLKKSEEQQKTETEKARELSATILYVQQIKTRTTSTTTKKKLLGKHPKSFKKRIDELEKLQPPTSYFDIAKQATNIAIQLVEAIAISKHNWIGTYLEYRNDLRKELDKVTTLLKQVKSEQCKNTQQEIVYNLAVFSKYIEDSTTPQPKQEN